MPAPLRRSRPHVLVLALAATALVWTLPVATQDRAHGRRHIRIGRHEAVEGEVLVQYRAASTSGARRRVETAASATEVEALDRRGVMRIRSNARRTSDLLDLLRADPDVEFVEPNYVVYATNVPDDPWFTSLWGLHNTGANPLGGGGVAGADIDAMTAWIRATGSRAHVVGVVDSGVDYTHPDLAPNMWAAPSAFQVTIGGQTITCQAGTHGFDTPWTPSAVFSWTPAHPHAGYQVAVRARSAWNTGTREMALVEPFPIMPRVTTLALGADVTAPQPPGTTVTWTASAGGGQPPYQYQWAVFDGAAWVDATDWTASATFTGSPALANPAYQIAVRARSAWNSGTRDVAAVHPFAIVSLVTSLALTPDVAAPRPPGTTITWTASAQGGQPPYSYQWAVFDGTTWVDATPWTTSPTFIWTPVAANANYRVAVRVRSAWNTGLRDMANTATFPIQ